MKASNKPGSPARRRFLKTAAAGTVVGIGLPLYGHEVEAEHLEVVHQEVRLAGWPPTLAGLRIGQLSDLHCHDARAVTRTARAAQMLVAQKPDAVFLTGDYITGQGDRGWARPCAEALAPLVSAPRGVYAVLGNHDWYSGHYTDRQEYVSQQLSGVGFQVLRNRSVPLPGAAGVWLVGLDDRAVGAHNPVEALQGVPETAIKLLLVHEPDYADEAPLGFALQLSGHSHAGQIRIPGLPPLHCPQYGQRYPEGLQQTTQHPVYTTRGVGMMGPQIRFCCPPEVTVLTLYPTV